MASVRVGFTERMEEILQIVLKQPAVRRNAQMRICEYRRLREKRMRQGAASSSGAIPD